MAVLSHKQSGDAAYAVSFGGDWEDRKRAQQVYDYYRVPPYWM